MPDIPERASVREAALVHFIGIDLAWGVRNPTGIAVVNEAGRLMHVAAVRTDAEIIETVQRYDGGALVAFDAPLIVTNEKGNRDAERQLNADFARFEAGAHPSNTGKPEFRDGTRGGALCATLGLDMDPASTASRRAIEVYPHPATVALFRLGRTLKYKDKRGREFATMRAELQALMSLLEGLATSDPALDLHADGSGWTRLVQQVATASRKSELRVVEDQVDAVVCAYVALFAVRRPQRTTTYGDFASGYIVTPTLPDDHEPGPGPEAASDHIAAAVKEYAGQLHEIATATERFVALVTTILDEAGINYLSVTGRAKSVGSFAGKAARRAEGELLYPDPLRDILDQIGVRVVTYVAADVAAVADLMRDQLVVKDDRDMGRETASEGRFGYASRHLLIALDAARAGQAAYTPARGRVASVQIRTVLQHAWAEFEHDIRYKGTVPEEHVREFDRRFTLAAGLLELADQEFSAIGERLRGGDGEPPEPVDDDPRIDPRELAAFLAGQYPDAGWSRTDHYAWISGLLLELAITSFDELSEVVRPVNELDLTARMGYRYPPGAVRRLDDALLAAFGERYVDLPGNAHRVPALRSRLERLRTAADA